MGGKKKKNKKARKPAVGNPAAGSNNKREKNDSQRVNKQPADKKNNNKKGQNSPKKEADVNKGRREEAKKVKGDKPKEVKKSEKEMSPKPEKAYKDKPKKYGKDNKEKLQRTEKTENKKNAKPERVKKEKPQKTVKAEKSSESKKRKKEKKPCIPLKERVTNFKTNYNMKKMAAFLIVAAVVAVVGIVAAVLLSVRNYPVPDYIEDAEFKGRMEPDSIAFDMDISKNQQELLSKATKAKGDRSDFDFFINDRIVMSEYDDPALIEFGSVDDNDCILMFFMIDEDGNELYRSLGVEPGKQIRSVLFFDEIPYGTHEVTIAVIGYDAKTFRKVGMQTTQIKLEIGV